MKLVFPYGIRFQEDGRIETFPMVEVYLKGRAGAGFRAAFHIDSGATTSIIPAGDAEALGVKPESGKRIIVRGIGDAALGGYRHFLRIELGRVNMRIPVVAVEYPNVPRMLGREGMFDRFAVIFDERKQRSGFLDAIQERKAIDSLFGA